MYTAIYMLIRANKHIDASILLNGMARRNNLYVFLRLGEDFVGLAGLLAIVFKKQIHSFVH